MPFEPEKFTNYYECDNCGTTWNDNWSCMCDDECPECGLDTSPSSSVELCLNCGTDVDHVIDAVCSECGEPIKDYDELQEELR